MKKILWSLVVTISVSALASAKAFPDPQGRVSDFAQILNMSTQQSLEQTITALEQSTSAELFVVTVLSLNGMSVEEYANKLFKQWGIGKKDKNNGVLILVAPSDRKMRIEVGYGLEPILPDGLAGAIIRDQMLPAFKAGDFNRGILEGARRVAEIVQANKPPAPGSFEEVENDKTMAISGLQSIFPALFFSVFVGIGFLMLGAGLGSKTFFPVVWGSGFGGMPLLMGILGPTGIASHYLLPPLAVFAFLFGFRIGRKPQNFLRDKKLAGTHTDGWTWGASGGSGSSGGSSGGGGGGGGGSSGGGGASGSW